MQLEWLGDDDLTVFAVTDAGHVWMSGDGAETWRDLTADASNPLSAGMADPADRPVCKNARRCEGGFLGIVTLDHMPNYVFFESKNDQHYATTDRGATFFKVSFGDVVLSSLRLHPSAPGVALALAVRMDCFTNPALPCAQDLLYCPQDLCMGAGAWKNITAHSDGRIVGFVDYDWAANAYAPPSAAPADELGILATVYETGEQHKAHAHAHTGGWDEDIDFVRSDDLFASDHEHVLACGNVLQALEGKLYVAVPHACASDGKDDDGGVSLMVSADGGDSFDDMCFPTTLLSDAFYITDGAEGISLVGVQHRGRGTSTSNLYSSGDRASLFSLSLEATHPTAVGTDVSRIRFDTQVPGATSIPEGVYLINRELHPESTLEPEVGTVITYNRGAQWQTIPAPTKDALGQPTSCALPECSLHLHGAASWYDEGFAGFYSHPSAPGYAMATGNLGARLEIESGLVNTYMTRDGGVTWEETLQGPHVYEYGDHGGIVVAARHYMAGATDHLVWSVAEGPGGRMEWTKLPLPKPMHVKNIRVENDNAARRFLVHGVVTTDTGDLKGGVALVDFEAKLDDGSLKQCKSADYELFTAPDCMLGARVSFTRRRATSPCYNGKEWSHDPATVEPCACTASDYECDYGAMRTAGGHACVPAVSYAELTECPAIKHKKYERSTETLLRYIAGDRCDMGGKEAPHHAGYWTDSWDGADHGVPKHGHGGGGDEKEKGGGMSGFGKFIVGVLVTAGVAAAALAAAHFAGMPVRDWLATAGDAAGAGWQRLRGMVGIGGGGGGGGVQAEYQAMRGEMFEPLAGGDEFAEEM